MRGVVRLLYSREVFLTVCERRSLIVNSCGDGRFVRMSGPYALTAIDAIEFLIATRLPALLLNAVAAALKCSFGDGNRGTPHAVG
jgi:hypothetical protein